MSWIDEYRNRVKEQIKAAQDVEHESSWSDGVFRCTCGYECKTEKTMENHIKKVK